MFFLRRTRRVTPRFRKETIRFSTKRSDSEAIERRDDDEVVVRVSKILAHRGMCSRREADEHIQAGRVVVDGQLATLGMKAKRSSDIEIIKDEQNRNHPVTIVLNKPYSFISQSSTPTRRQRFAKDLLTWKNQHRECTYDRRAIVPARLKKLAVAGRLDTQSSGLLVFTQDGVVARKIVGSNGESEKEYIVTVRASGTRKGGSTGPICSERCLERLRNFGKMDGKQLRPAIVDKVEPRSWRPEPRLGLWPEHHELHRKNDVQRFEQLRFVLREGRYHQIRRMCDAVGLDVHALVRVRVGNFTMGDLRSGFWTQIDASEIFE